jgi:plastocyanin
LKNIGNSVLSNNLPRARRYTISLLQPMHTVPRTARDVSASVHMRRFRFAGLLCSIAILSSCSPAENKQAAPETKKELAPVYFHVDPATAASVTGAVHFTGKKPARKIIDMSNDPACVSAHAGKATDEAVVADAKGGLANAFVYIKSGLEGKKFEVPTASVALDQHGCWFNPRVIGIQVGQPLQITNSDPVTHNVHPQAQINREWNHSQGPGEAPLDRKFVKPEVMIRVKCNIHSWMRAFIGVVEHPYFAVTGADGTFELRNVPPGEYVLEAWQETLGTQEQKITVTPSGKIETSFTFKGE